MFIDLFFQFGRDPRLALSIAFVLAVLSDFVSAEESSFATLVKPFLASHCLKCHGPAKQEGELRLDDLKSFAEQDLQRWNTILDQLRDGLMPPED